MLFMMALSPINLIGLITLIAEMFKSELKSPSNTNSSPVYFITLVSLSMNSFQFSGVTTLLSLRASPLASLASRDASSGVSSRGSLSSFAVRTPLSTFISLSTVKPSSMAKLSSSLIAKDALTDTITTKSNNNEINKVFALIITPHLKFLKFE